MTDIGGSHGGHPADPAYRELLSAGSSGLLPFARDASARESRTAKGPLGRCRVPERSAQRDLGLWRGGRGHFKRYIALRYRFRKYTRRLLQEAHNRGTPVMRPVFYGFSDDKMAWEEDVVTRRDMFGERYLSFARCLSRASQPQESTHHRQGGDR